MKLNPRQQAALEKRARKGGEALAETLTARCFDEALSVMKTAQKNGTPFADVKKQLRYMLDGWHRATAPQLDTIVATTMQTAYVAGRTRELLEPENLVRWPYWRFSALLDMRTTRLCERCNGTILVAGNGWWRSHTPPLHYRCRSTVHGIAERNDDFETTRSPTKLRPQDGFGALLPMPRLLQLDSIDPDLAKAVRVRQR